MGKKKVVWFTVEENETIEDCLKRLSAAGYEVAGRKEEPQFIEKDGQYRPIRQVIQFKAILRS